mmetsp:Transcript_42609/g.109615  ORF Transcript_42609/g.109615 Transcript_42609/m.109615 type:complete len:84 (-) Transcript_42609:20-271(-)
MPFTLNTILSIYWRDESTSMGSRTLQPEAGRVERRVKREDRKWAQRKKEVEKVVFKWVQKKSGKSGENSDSCQCTTKRSMHSW